MLRSYDEAATLDKLAAQREQEDMIEEEGVQLSGYATNRHMIKRWGKAERSAAGTDDDEPEDRRAEVEQPAQRSDAANTESPAHPAVQMPAGTPAAANAALASAAAAAIRQDEADRLRSPADERKVPAWGGVTEPGAGDQPQAPAARQPPGGAHEAVAAEQTEALDGAQSAAEAAGPSYVRIPEDERMQLEGDFLELMQVPHALPYH